MTTFYAAIMTFLMAMVPVIELRGAIPFGAANGLSPWVAMAIAVLGNLAPIPILLLFTRQVLNWLRRFGKFGKLVDKLEARAANKSEVVKKYQNIGLCILVAIPLPGTGAWTGALVATFLDMRLKRAFPVIALGVLLAGIIVMLACMGVIHLAGIVANA